jgi:D-alanyl-D-alanine carboxypeptidase
MKVTFSASRRSSRRRVSTCLLFAATLGLSRVTHAAPPAADVPQGAATELDQIVTRAFPTDAPGVAVLVVQHGEIKLRKGYGMADLEQGTRVDPSNVFRLCSVTKQFTAVAILQLVEAGKLGLDDDIRKYLPDYPTRSAAITVAQLLNHTAGIPDIDLSRPEWKKRWAEVVTPDEAIAATNTLPLDFAPGTDWKYSNNGYALLGKIIEQVSGESYADYVRKHLFAPAKMEHSYYADSEPIIPGRIPGYSRSGKKWTNALVFNMTITYSGGALLSTVDDMWRWEQALEAGQLVKPELLTKARTEVVLPDGRGSHYGLGWEVDRVGDHPMTCHGGGIPGYSAFEISVPDAGLYVVALANTESPRTELRLLTTRLAKAALGISSVANGPFAAEHVEDYVGDYRMGGGAVFKVTVKDGVLSGQLGRGSRRLIALAKDEFTTADNENLIKFVRGATGEVVKISFRSDGAGPDLIWPRAVEKTDGASGPVRP